MCGVVAETGQQAGKHRIGLADALFSGTRQKVLGALFGQPDRPYSISELIELAGGGSGAVQREVSRLVSTGLVTVTHAGRQKRYRANPDSPIFQELCALVRKTLGPEERLRAALSTLADQLDLAVLYGSVAKGADRADSDIDLLLVSDTLTLEDVFKALAPAEAALGRQINPTLYTRQEFRRRRETDSPFLRRVLSGPYVILKGSIDDGEGARKPGSDRPAET